MNKLTIDVIEWTRNYVNSINPKCKVVIGISGGVDSTTCAAILKEAIGVDRIIAVQMPNGLQVDFEDSNKVIEDLGLKNHYLVNIGSTCKVFNDTIKADLNLKELPDTFTTNTPARLRMTTLYGIAAIVGNCVVVNTCNLSEDVVGYSTKFGDHAGDFSIINKLTKTEVRGIAADLEVCSYLVNKTPTDGMSLNDDGSLKSDEDKLGVTYEALDTLIRTGKCDDIKIIQKVNDLYKKNLHKFDLDMPHFDPHYYRCFK